MDLNDYQAKLEQHFAQLQILRTQSSSSASVFGLEHGLSIHELHELESLVKEGIRKGPLNRSYWLPWLVFASEIGYRYVGSEYWQTFEAETVGWLERGDRYFIRSCFQKFHKTFQGAKPSGPWAETFTIICWPITHAILPKDLQKQLAQILYELRYSFVSFQKGSEEKLGELIEARSWNCNTRFQQLAQERRLLGQIATALLVPDQNHASGLIWPATLRRISEDLQKERQAREWLSDARQHAQRVSVAGVRAPGNGGQGSTASGVASLEQKVQLPEPDLSLRPDGKGNWEVILELPRFSPLLDLMPDLAEPLSSSRCYVQGAAGSPIWQGRVLREAVRVLLRRWPGSQEPLLRFDREPTKLTLLLKTVCLLPPGPQWLFRVNCDGTARRQQSRAIRPGQSYILLAATRPTTLPEGVKEVALLCDGITALQVNAPDTVSHDWLDSISHLGLQQALSIKVAPLGLCPALWDGEGRAEWLCDDPPCIVISADCPLDFVQLTLDGDEAGQIDCESIKAGQPLLVELAGLAIGTHRLKVVADLRRDGKEDEEEGYLNILVRPPRDWIAGDPSQGTLSVLIEPAAPSLEQFWEGKLGVEILGPPGRKVRTTVSLYERQSFEPTYRKTLEPLVLPVDSATWKGHLEHHVTRVAEAQEHYDLAQRSVLEWSADEFGHKAVTLEREFTPLRWSVRRTASHYCLRLVDDTGAPGSASIEHYPFECPDQRQTVEAPGQAFESDVRGGLFSASRGGLSSSVVVAPSTGPTIPLEALQFRAVASAVTRTEEAMESRIRLALKWSQARVRGHILALTRRRAVVQTLLRGLFEALGGANWGLAEQRFSTSVSEPTMQDLKRAITCKPHQAGLGAKLLLDRERLMSSSPDERALELAESAKTYLVLPLGKPELVALSQFALRVASCSRTIELSSPEEMRASFSLLLDCPALARAARFLVLVGEQTLPARPLGGGAIYQGWDWE